MTYPMSFLISPVFAILSVFAFAAPSFAAPKTAPAGGGEVETATRASYVLKSDDVLALSVFEEPDLATTTKILKSGEVVFPLIGTVKVGGLDLDTATSRVRELYAAKYLVNPRVSLTVSSYGEQSVTVLGAVKSPGLFAVPPTGSMDLASAIALAGGLSDDADSRSISLIRAGGATSVYSKEELLSRGGSVKLSGGDRVLVGQSSFVGKAVTVFGRVMRPGPVDFPADGNLDLVGAISRAGGFHPLANSRKVNLNRGGKVEVIDVRELSERGGKAFKLLPGDVITVPERYF